MIITISTKMEAYLSVSYVHYADIYIISRRHHRDAPVEIMLLRMSHPLELFLSGLDFYIVGSHGSDATVAVVMTATRKVTMTVDGKQEDAVGFNELQARGENTQVEEGKKEKKDFN